MADSILIHGSNHKMKMKNTIQEITKETFKLLSSYLGLSFETNIDASSGKRSDIPIQTPDFFNSRSNGGQRKNLNSNRYP